MIYFIVSCTNCMKDYLNDGANVRIYKIFKKIMRKLSFIADTTSTTIKWSNKNLKAIPVEKLPNALENLSISNNPISDLSILPRFHTLLRLSCDGTLIFTFEGVVDQPRLNSVSLINTPISTLPCFRLMASIAFGRSVVMINGEPLSISDGILRDTYGPVIKSWLFKGYVVISLDPLIIYNPKTKERKKLNIGPIGEEIVEPAGKQGPIDNIVDDVIDDISSHGKPNKKRSALKLSRQQAEKLNYYKDKKAIMGSYDIQTNIELPFPSYH